MVKIKSVTKKPDKSTVGYLQVLIMPNGEIINLGKSIGWISDLKKYLIIIEE